MFQGSAGYVPRSLKLTLLKNHNFCKFLQLAFFQRHDYCHVAGWLYYCQNAQKIAVLCKCSDMAGLIYLQTLTLRIHDSISNHSVECMVTAVFSYKNDATLYNSIVLHTAARFLSVQAVCMIQGHYFCSNLQTFYGLFMDFVIRQQPLQLGSKKYFTVDFFLTNSKYSLPSKSIFRMPMKCLLSREQKEFSPWPCTVEFVDLMI